MVANLMFTSYEENNCFILPKVLKNVEIMFYFVVDNKIISGIENTITEQNWKNPYIYPQYKRNMLK
jgi:hypothetical protein